jgi:hypothetical protein
MKKLTPDQLIFASRVITETMVQAQMGKLTRWTSLSTGTSLALSTTEWFGKYSQSSNSTVKSYLLNTTQHKTLRMLNICWKLFPAMRVMIQVSIINHHKA